MNSRLQRGTVDMLEQTVNWRVTNQSRFLDGLGRRPLYSPDSHVAADRKGSFRWNSNRSTSTNSAAKS